MLETATRMLKVYEEQVRNLKDDWKNGKCDMCERDYKIQLGIWEKRIKEYQAIIDKN